MHRLCALGAVFLSAGCLFNASGPRVPRRGFCARSRDVATLRDQAGSVRSAADGCLAETTLAMRFSSEQASDLNSEEDWSRRICSEVLQDQLLAVLRAHDTGKAIGLPVSTWVEPPT
nr:uncharacterized protein LOC129380425 isoform X2 [Dermacentor andersoni]